MTRQPQTDAADDLLDLLNRPAKTLAELREKAETRAAYFGPGSAMCVECGLLLKLLAEHDPPEAQA